MIYFVIIWGGWEVAVVLGHYSTDCSGQNYTLLPFSKESGGCCGNGCYSESNFVGGKVKNNWPLNDKKTD